jgi:hypothetical protein
MTSSVSGLLVKIPLNWYNAESPPAAQPTRDTSQGNFEALRLTQDGATALELKR